MSGDVSWCVPGARVMVVTVGRNVDSLRATVVEKVGKQQVTLRDSSTKFNLKSATSDGGLRVLGNASAIRQVLLFPADHERVKAAENRLARTGARNQTWTAAENLLVAIRREKSWEEVEAALVPLVEALTAYKEAMT